MSKIKNMLKYILLSITVFLCACSRPKSSNEKPVAEEKTASETQTQTEAPTPANVDYSFIESKNIDSSERVLICVIDPHGKGNEAITHFTKLTELVNCTVIGLNNVSNKTSNYLQIISENIDAAKAEFNLADAKIFVCGFSAGATIAYNYARSNKVDGVMMTGMLPNFNDLQNKNFPLVVAIGNLDFNFINLFNINIENEKMFPSYACWVFEGKHEWATDQNILNAISFLFSENGIKTPYSVDYQTLFDGFVRQKKYYLALRSLYFGNSLYKDKKIEKQIDKLVQQKEFVEFMTNFENILLAESDRTNFYFNNLEQKNETWWRNEIGEFEQKLSKKNTLEVNSYKRTKAVLGILMYMKVSEEIKNMNSLSIEKFLTIYELLEPENSDMWFFKAVRQKQLQNVELSNQYFEKALKFGFSDTIAAENQGFKI